VTLRLPARRRYGEMLEGTRTCGTFDEGKVNEPVQLQGRCSAGAIPPRQAAQLRPRLGGPEDKTLYITCQALEGVPASTRSRRGAQRVASPYPRHRLPAGGGERYVVDAQATLVRGPTAPST